MLLSAAVYHVQRVVPFSAVFVSGDVGTTTQVTLGRALVLLVGVVEAAALADTVGRIRSNIHMVAEVAVLVQMFILLLCKMEEVSVEP